MKECIITEFWDARCHDDINFFGENIMIETNKNIFRDRYPKEETECLCGKRLYPSKKDALTAKNKREKCGSKKLRVYPCPSGEGWHLTHIYAIQPKQRKSVNIAKRFKNYPCF